MHPYRQGNLAVVIGTSLVGVIGAMVVVSLRGAVVPRSGPSLPVYGHVPDFLLVDHQARPISRASLAGSVWIADFIFTRCAGQCPLLSMEMAKLERTLRGMPGVRFVSFSVDPAYDTPERLAAYAAHYGADTDRWRFVTGEPAAVTSLIQQGFHLALGTSESAKEPITHSVRLVLIDRRGSIRGYYDATDPRAMAALHDDARRLVRQR